MDQLIAKLSKLDIFRCDYDQHLVGPTMVIISLIFGRQRYFERTRRKKRANAIRRDGSYGNALRWTARSQA